MRVSGPSNRPSPNLSPHRHPRADIFQGRFVRGAWDRPLGVRARPHGRANPTIRHFADRERKGSRRDASGALIQTEADRAFRSRPLARRPWKHGGSAGTPCRTVRDARSHTPTRNFSKPKIAHPQRLPKWSRIPREGHSVLLGRRIVPIDRVGNASLTGTAPHEAMLAVLDT